MDFKCIPVSRRVNQKSKCSLNEWEIKGQVGEESMYGDVYAACCKSDCTHVMKIQKIVKGGTTDQENEMQVLAAERGLAPLVVDSYVCDDNSIIIMKAMKRTVYDLLKEIFDSQVHLLIIKECMSLVKEAHRLGYIHGDTHLNNFMIDYLPENYIKALPYIGKNNLKAYRILDPEYKFIDFGYSGPATSLEDLREDYIKMFLHLQRLYENLPEEELPSYAKVLEMIATKIHSISQGPKK